MYHFCTYFDKNYLASGLALFQSLQKYAGNFELHILCMDDYVYRFFSEKKFPCISLISLEEFERNDKELLKAKNNRRLLEYYYTSTPSLPLFVLDRNPDIDIITYLDADVFFYSDPAPLYKELGTGSILMIPHRFTEDMRHMEIYGLYNVGLLSFRNDAIGRSCLAGWRTQCLEWCYLKPENGKFADQKYLDQWPSLYDGIVVTQHKGAGVGIWDTHTYRYDLRENDITIDDEKLIFYHFHGLRTITRNLFHSGCALTPPVIHYIYAPYIRDLQHIWEKFSEVKRFGSLKKMSGPGQEPFIIIVMKQFLAGYSLHKYLFPFLFIKRIVMGMRKW